MNLKNRIKAVRLLAVVWSALAFIVLTLFMGYFDNSLKVWGLSLVVFTVVTTVIFYITGELKNDVARFKNNSGLIVCLILVVMIILIADFFYQNGLPDKLKTIGLDSIENSKVIRNYFLIFVASASAPFLVWRAIIANRNADTNRNNQITQAYSTAIDQLGSTYSNDKPNIETRLGAIYTLEKIALSNKDYYQSIIEILASYVRHNSPNIHKNINGHVINKSSEDNSYISIVIQTILTVIGREETLSNLRYKLIDLTCCNLRGFKLQRVNLWRVQLRNSDLRDTDLSGADLRRADLRDADLRLADLRDAHLTNADLSGANLKGANLKGANLKGADLTNIKKSKKTKFPKGYEYKVKNVSFQEYDEFTGKWTNAVK